MKFWLHILINFSSAENEFFQILWKCRCHILVTFPSHLKKLCSILRFWLEKCNCGFFHSFLSRFPTFFFILQYGNSYFLHWNFDKKSCFVIVVFFLEWNKWKNPQFNFSSQNLHIERNFFKWDGKETKILHLLFHRIWKKNLHV